MVLKNGLKSRLSVINMNEQQWHKSSAKQLCHIKKNLKNMNFRCRISSCVTAWDWINMNFRCRESSAKQLWRRSVPRCRGRSATPSPPNSARRYIFIHLQKISRRNVHVCQMHLLTDWVDREIPWGNATFYPQTNQKTCHNVLSSSIWQMYLYLVTVLILKVEGPVCEQKPQQKCRSVPQEKCQQVD